MNFRVGQKVGSIVDRESSYGPALDRGQPYTIRRIFSHFKTGEAMVCLEEHEIVLTSTPNGEMGWKATLFRPLVETDIEIFQAMLVNPHREVETIE